MMKLQLLLVLTFTIVSTTLIAQRTEVVTENVEASFTFYAKDVEGTIGNIKANILLDDEDLKNSSISGSASIGTIKTANFLRDKHLMWKKYFYKKLFPEVSFESTSIEKTEDDMYHVIGVMTLKGKKREVTMEFAVKDEELRGFCSINISDFGINVLKLDKDNRVDIKFTFTLNGASEAPKEASPEEEEEEEEEQEPNENEENK